MCLSNFETHEVREALRETSRVMKNSGVNGGDVVSPDYVRALYTTYKSGGAGRRMAMVHARPMKSFEESATWADPSAADVERLEREEVQRRFLFGRIRPAGNNAPRDGLRREQLANLR